MLSANLTPTFRPAVGANPQGELTSTTTPAVGPLPTDVWMIPLAVVVGERMPATSEPDITALIGPVAAPTSAEMRRPDTVMGSMLALSAPLVVTTKDVPAGPRVTVAPSDPGAERTGVPEKWTVDAFALSVIVTTRVPPAFANPLTLLSVNVNEAVPADEPPGRTLPAEVTEVDASAGTAPITMTSPASSVAARPKLTARLIWLPTSGSLQLLDLTLTDAAVGVVTAVVRVRV
jgi:hypothetical protein